MSANRSDNNSTARKVVRPLDGGDTGADVPPVMRAAPVFQAIAEGHAELQLVRPELRRDEEPHESITDFLGDWHLAEGSDFGAARVIGRHDERTSTLRDAFARAQKRWRACGPGAPEATKRGSQSV